MEFFIKKNATLPVLKINIIKDGRSDYDRTMRFLSGTDIFFSMVDTVTGIPKITSRPAGLKEKQDFNNNEELQYYVYYQFTPFDTKVVGRYKGQFLVKNETGVLTLPLNQEIYINVTDSFILDDMEYQSCYVVDFPCCKSGGIIPPVPPITTTTTTVIPTTTTTTIVPTPTITQTPTVTVTPTITQTPTVTVTPSITPTQGSSPTPTPTQTLTPTVTVTPSITPTQVSSPTPTPTLTQTPTPTPQLLIDPIITQDDVYIVVGNNEYLIY